MRAASGNQQVPRLGRPQDNVAMTVLERMSVGDLIFSSLTEALFTHNKIQVFEMHTPCTSHTLQSTV